MVSRDTHVCNLHVKIKATCNVVAFYVHVQTVLINNAEMNNISV